jgi:hypothetical protein
MFCNKCGQEITEGSIFCPKCGANHGIEQKKEKSITVELVLGLLGGIFGFFGAVFAIGIGGLAGAFGASGASEVVGLGFAAIVFSIIGIIGGVLAKSKTKTRTAGWLMIISAFGGLISISFAFLLPFILLLIGGILALRK